MTLSITPASRTMPVTRPGRRAGLVIALLGVFAGAVTMIGAGVPSYWGDEAASVISAQRPLASLWSELLHVDAVHGMYYLLLHVWVSFAGTTEAAVRFPSAVAAGFAVAGTAALGRELFGMRVAVLAGLTAATIPQLTRMAVEARSYALTMAVAVWLTWWLVRLIRRGETRRRMWAIYPIGAALSIVLFMYLALMVIVHVVVVATMHPTRPVARVWIRSLACAGAAALPLIVLATSQQGQVAFLAHRHYATFANVIGRQWFGAWYIATLAWALIVVGVVTTLRHPAREPDRGSALVVWTWLALPTAVLLCGNAWLHPMYNMRYLTFCVPAAALAIALGVDGLSRLVRGPRLRTAVAVSLIAALAAVSAPTFAAQRTPYAKDGGSDLRQVADAVRQHGLPGEAIVFDESTKPRLERRLAIDLYPTAFAGLDDVALRTRAADTTGLWDRVAPLDALSADLLPHPVVWAVEAAHTGSRDIATLTALGYRVTETIRLHRTDLYRLTKDRS